MPKSNRPRRSLEHLRQLRAKVVKLRRGGMKIKEVAEACGLSKTTVIAVCKAYRDGGRDAVKLKQRGRPKCSGRAMSASQEAEAIRVMLEKTPDHLSMDGCLWTSAAVRKLVLDSCGLQLTDRAIRNYLERWGLTRGRRSNKDIARMSGLQKRWFDMEYPNVQARAYLDGASICFLNLVVLSTSEMMEAAGLSARFRVDSASLARQARQWIVLRALSSQGHMSWKIYPGRLTTSALKDFCDRLHRDVNSKILVVLESTKQARSVRVQTWLSRRKGKIQFEFMPGSVDTRPEGL
jgi:transposase